MTKIAKPTARPSCAEDLDDKEWLFVSHYVTELSGIEAALAAGLTTDRKHARELACRMRKRPDVADAIARLLSERAGASKARVLDEISSIAFATAGEEVSVGDKLNALELLSKVLGLQVHKQEISGPGGKPVAFDVDASTARERIAAELDALAARLPAPSERPIMIDVSPAPSAVPAGQPMAPDSSGKLPSPKVLE
jgi:phage terminase small subunit